MIYSKVFNAPTPSELEDEIDIWLASVDSVDVLSTHFDTLNGFSVFFLYEDIVEENN